MSVLLLRHGETEWSLLGRLQGRTDTPLSAKGYGQALEAARCLPKFDLILTSPLRRAAVVANAIGGRQDTEVRTEALLVERSWREWEGMHADDVHERWPGWLDNGRRPRGFEADGEVHQRVSRVLVGLSNWRASDVLLVTHGGLMSAVVRQLKGDSTTFKNLVGQWIVAGALGPTLGERRQFASGARRLAH